jgi:hypothetical protein
MDLGSLGQTGIAYEIIISDFLTNVSEQVLGFLERILGICQRLNRGKQGLSQGE